MAKKKKETQDEKIKAFLATARKRLESEIKADSENRREAIECLMFTVPGNQWNQREKDERTKDGRPCLEVPLTHKFTAQVVGDMLHNRARVSVKPVDSKADPHIAKIRAGIIANTEYISNAEDIYLEAGKMQVSCGYGAWRIGTRYCEDNPFLQEIYMEGIPNPFMVYLDSKRKDPAGTDAKYGFVLEKMPRELFDKYWPNATPPDKMPMSQGMRNENWFDKETITVAEYFIVKPEPQSFCQMEDGRVYPKDEAEKIIAQWDELYAERLKEIQALGTAPVAAASAAPSPVQPVPGAVPPPQQPQPGGPMGGPPQPPPPKPLPPRPKIIKQRTTPVNRIRHYTITMNEILPPRKDDWQEAREEDGLTPDKLLEGELVPGKYIPLVEVSGPTLNVEGKTYRKGLIKDAKDAQKLINYYESSLAEVIAIAPKSPWLATAEQIEGYETDYINANTKNYAVLKYNAVVGDNGQLLPPPQRQQPGAPPVALFTQVQRSHDNLKAVIGMFGGDVGEVGPERSAPAVMAKQRPGDISTYVYGYNLNRAIEHSGKIISEMIPEVYDSERDVRLRNVDDTEAIVPINTTAGAAHKRMNQNPARYKGLDAERLTKIIQSQGKGALFNDVTVGKYDIVITVGPSYATQRQETAQMLMTMTQADPRGMAQFRDIIFENMDFKDAERLASRVRRAMPPGMVELKEGEQPIIQPPPPQVQLAGIKLEGEKLKIAERQGKLAKEQQVSQVDAAKQQMELQIAQLKKELEELRALAASSKASTEGDIITRRAEAEREKIALEVRRVELSIQQQREAHEQKMVELSEKKQIL